MTEFELLVDLHKENHRQGPGDDNITLTALELIGADRFSFTNIADIGCGTGASTLVLAQNTRAHITAIDLFDEFLDRLNKEASRESLSEQITTKSTSMESLPFKDEELDMIWSEGAIYNMGFREGVEQWRRFLKKGGYLAVSELSWTTATRPEELEAHWRAEYPQVDTVSAKISILEKAGYQPVAHFVLPEYCWTENYYNPLIARFSEFLCRNDCDAAKEIVENEKTEIEFYEKYKEYYSYGFYIAKKL